MRPTLKASLLAAGVLAGGVVLWVAWLILGVLYAGERSHHRAEQAVVAITAITGLAFLFGAIPVYRGARKFGAPLAARAVVTLAYLGASAIAVFVSFFFTALAFNR